jgi:hypothetical protein
MAGGLDRRPEGGPAPFEEVPERRLVVGDDAVLEQQREQVVRSRGDVVDRKRCGCSHAGGEIHPDGWGQLGRVEDGDRCVLAVVLLAVRVDEVAGALDVNSVGSFEKSSEVVVDGANVGAVVLDVGQR